MWRAHRRRDRTWTSRLCCASGWLTRVSDLHSGPAAARTLRCVAAPSPGAGAGEERGRRGRDGGRRRAYTHCRPFENAALRLDVPQIIVSTS
eukprot:6643510-Prymnesium_polylepis.1